VRWPQINARKPNPEVSESLTGQRRVNNHVGVRPSLWAWRGSRRGQRAAHRRRPRLQPRVLVEGGGIPLAWILTAGSRNDFTQLLELLERYRPSEAGRAGIAAGRAECERRKVLRGTDREHGIVAARRPNRITRRDGLSQAFLWLVHVGHLSVSRTLAFAAFHPTFQLEFDPLRRR
jgi:hypothetical protein